MTANPRDLTTVADVAAYLNLSAPTLATDADLLQRLVTAASVFIQTHLNRDLGKVSRFTECRNGNGNQIMPFADYPVTNIVSVTIDDKDIPQSFASRESGWVFDEVALYLRGFYRFTRDIQNVLITYDAGYASVPEDVAQVAVQLCARWYKDRTRIGISSKGMGSENVVFSKVDLTDEFKSLLRQYQKTLPI
jgi:hypothetical protein